MEKEQRIQAFYLSDFADLSCRTFIVLCQITTTFVLAVFRKAQWASAPQDFRNVNAPSLTELVLTW